MVVGRALLALTRPLDPEWAHRLTIDILAAMPPATVKAPDSAMAIDCAGLSFAHPVGLAAGFDKDARAIHTMARFGFAAVEAGTLTPLPQQGNARPRLFRLVPDAAVINRMGFNNGGQVAALPRISSAHGRAGRALIGINIGANKESADRVGDYVAGVERMAGCADWLTLNISSPNTPGLRALQDEGALDDLLARTAAARPSAGPPLFLKVAPDLDHQQIGGVVASAIAHSIDGIIIGNTTVSRPQLQSVYASESGGLSGAPLAPLALARLRDFRSATGGQLPLVAAGGIANADDVWIRLRAGASLVQLYSALVYHGPWLAAAIVRDLRARMRREGVVRLAELIDADHR